MSLRDDIEAGGDQTPVTASESLTEKLPAVVVESGRSAAAVEIAEVRAAAEIAEAECPTPAPRPLESLPRGSIRRQVFVLALPVLAEQMGVFTVGLVDMLLAGHINKEAIAAIGTGSYLTWLINLSFALVGVGVAALVSRATGARDTTLANRATNQALLLALTLGASMTLLAFGIAPLLADWVAQTPEAHAMIVRFVRIDSFGFVLASVNLVGAGALRAAGDMRTPMLTMLAVNVVNIAVGAGLVYAFYLAGPGTAFYGGPLLGLSGIAIGALVARSTGGLIMLTLLLRGVRQLQFRRSLLRPDWAVMWRMLRIGLPAAGEVCIMCSAQMVFLRIISRTAEGEASTVNFAAHMISMRVEAFSYLTAFSWGTAAMTLVGQYLGARRPDDAARSGRVAALQGICIGVVMGVIFFAFAGPIFRLLSNDPAVVSVGTGAFRLIGFAQPFLAIAIIFSYVLRGAGDTRYPMLIAAICSLLVRLPGAYLGGIVLGGGLIGAWCGMWADNLTRSVLASARFLRGRWRFVKV